MSRSLSFQYFYMNPKARPRDTISSEYAFARFLLTRSATTPACRLSIVLTILGTGKYRYRWNVAPLNNISSQDFSFRIFFPKPARALLSNAPRIIKIGSLVQFWHPKEFVDPLSSVFQYPCSYLKTSTETVDLPVMLKYCSIL